MRPTKETFRIAKEAAFARGWKRVSFEKCIEDGVVYYLHYDCTPGACVGIPQFVIVHKDLSVSWITIRELP